MKSNGFEQPVTMTIKIPCDDESLSVATIQMQVEETHSRTTLEFAVSVAELKGLSVMALQASQELEEIIVARATQNLEDNS